MYIYSMNIPLSQIRRSNNPVWLEPEEISSVRANYWLEGPFEGSECADAVAQRIH